MAREKFQTLTEQMFYILLCLREERCGVHVMEAEAKLTGGYDLPCKYVIHTVGPVWHGGSHGERELLTACYRNSLALAKEKDCKTVAFPLISAGVYHYPKEEALEVAMTSIRRFAGENMTVYLVAYDTATFRLGQQVLARLDQE